MQKLCCVRTRQQFSASLVYYLSPAYLTISPSILNHFWWELYHMVKATPTICSSGQIEWFKNSVDDRSVQVGDKQRICTIDGYAMPLVCRGGLMYLSHFGTLSDEDLERYPSVHLTGLHEWDPSVLDCTCLSGDGEPPWPIDPTERFPLDPTFDEFGNYNNRSI